MTQDNDLSVNVAVTVEKNMYFPCFVVESYLSDLISLRYNQFLP